jgi:hypothetical protein
LIRHHATITDPHFDLSEVIVEVMMIEIIDCITLALNDDKCLYKQ